MGTAKKLSDKNTDRAWEQFERSGSIEAFLTYHQLKPEKVAPGEKDQQAKLRQLRKK